MEGNGKLNKRVNQVEEQLAITLKAVDKLTADMQEFREYAYQSNQTFNKILNKLDDHQEEIEHLYKSQEKISYEVNKRQERISNEINNRQEKMSNEFNRRQEKMSTEFNNRQEKMSTEVNKRLEKMSDDFNKRQEKMLGELAEDRRLRQEELKRIDLRLQKLEI